MPDDHKNVAWVCPRNGMPLHFEMTRAKQKLPSPREILCAACHEDHWEPARTMFGNELEDWDVVLVFGRGRDW